MRHWWEHSSASLRSLATEIDENFQVESAQSDNPPIYEVPIDGDQPDQAIMANFSLIELLENQILGK